MVYKEDRKLFDKLPGKDALIARLKQGDVVVTRERLKDGKLIFRSFPICLGGRLDAEDVMKGLLKEPLKVAQPMARPGDVLVLWHAGD